MKASGNLLSRAHLWNKYVLPLLSSRSILQLLFPCQITVLAKKESPVQSLLSPLKSSPGVSMAQSSCLLLLNSVSIKAFAVSICTPAALIATKVTAQCWLFGKASKDIILLQDRVWSGRKCFFLWKLSTFPLSIVLLRAYLFINQHFVVQSRKKNTKSFTEEALPSFYFYFPHS